MIEEFIYRVPTEVWFALAYVFNLVVTIAIVILIAKKFLCRHAYKHVGYMDGKNIFRCTKCNKLKYKEYRM